MDLVGGFQRETTLPVCFISLMDADEGYFWNTQAMRSWYLFFFHQSQNICIAKG